MPTQKESKICWKVFSAG